MEFVSRSTVLVLLATTGVCAHAQLRPSAPVNLSIEGGISSPAPTPVQSGDVPALPSTAKLMFSEDFNANLDISGAAGRKWDYEGVEPLDTHVGKSSGGMVPMYSLAAAGDWRTEMVPSNYDSAAIQAGATYRVVVRLQAPVTWSYIPEWWAHVLQYHATGAGTCSDGTKAIDGRNIITLNVSPGNKLNVAVNNNGGGTATGTGIANTVAGVPWQYGHMYEVVFRVRASTSTDGFVETYIDGNRVYQATNIATADKYDTCGNPIPTYFYLKLGVYEDKRDTSTQSIAYDDFKLYRE